MSLVDDVDISRDRLLVLRYQEGDRSAFDELYRLYFPRLVRFCSRKVATKDVAEELAQETFTRALANLDGFAGERHFYPWLTVIAARLCVDDHRRRARMARVAHAPPQVDELDTDAVVARVDRAQVVAAMKRLTPRHQQVLQLREVEGWSYQRIADHLGSPLGTVEVLLWRARNALRREFAHITGERLNVLIPLPVLRLARWLRARAAGPVELVGPLAGQAAAVAAAAVMTFGLATGDPSTTVPRTGGSPAATTFIASDGENGAATTGSTFSGASASPGAAVSNPGGRHAGLADIAPGEAPRTVSPDGAREASPPPVVDAGGVYLSADPEMAKRDTEDTTAQFIDHVSSNVGRLQ